VAHPQEKGGKVGGLDPLIFKKRGTVVGSTEGIRNFAGTCKTHWQGGQTKQAMVRRRLAINNLGGEREGENPRNSRVITKTPDKKALEKTKTTKEGGGGEAKPRSEGFFLWAGLGQAGGGEVGDAIKTRVVKLGEKLFLAKTQ